MTEPRVLTTSILSATFDFTTDYYKLGVPAPAAALTIDAGYTPGATYRAYIYTYVVKLGTTDAEEGQNSAIASITDYGSGDVTLSGFTEPPASRSIGKIRIYRTAASTSGVAEFLFVGEFDTAGVDFSTYTFTDDVADSALGEAFTCEDWAPPPATLAGLIAPDGGSLAGFVGNRVYISEPFLPHAWPYSYPVDSTIVGLGYIGNTIVVLTDEFIYLMSGTADAMSTTKLNGRFTSVDSVPGVSVPPCFTTTGRFRQPKNVSVQRSATLSPGISVTSVRLPSPTLPESNVNVRTRTMFAPVLLAGDQ